MLTPGSTSPRRPGSILWGLGLAGALIWSLLAWLAYGAADGLVAFAGANAQAALAGIRGLAEAAGVGREAGALLQSIGLAGMVEQAVALLGWLVMPVIVLAWLVGMMAVLAAPLLLARLSGRLGSGGRSHR